MHSDGERGQSQTVLCVCVSSENGCDENVRQMFGHGHDMHIQ